MLEQFQTHRTNLLPWETVCRWTYIYINLYIYKPIYILYITTYIHDNEAVKIKFFISK